MTYEYKTKGTCSQKITFDIENGIVTNVKFSGGCNGNLKAISSLVEGCDARVIAQKCGGIRCGFKDTSCGDQLAHAVMEALEKEEQEKN